MIATFVQINHAHALLRGFEEEIERRVGLRVRLSMHAHALISKEAKDLLPVIAAALGRDVKDYRNTSKSREVVHLRFMAALFLRDLFPGISYSAIADWFGQDHSTIIAGLDASKRLLETNDQYFTTKYIAVKNAVDEWIGR